MPSGLAALLDDVATIAKIAASSIDDVAAAAGKASTKAAGVVIDDTAVTPQYVTGFTPDRELPIIWRIARGSFFNKLVIILPVALLLSAFLPWAITPILMIGGAYLCFEGAEKVLEKFADATDGHEETLDEEIATLSSAEHEEKMVAGAVRTDFILSAEIMAIALNDIIAGGALAKAGGGAAATLHPIAWQGISLAVVAIGITIAVYGVVGLIVKMDDIGLHMAQRKNGGSRAVGRALVKGMPKLLALLSTIGTAAMLWVGGQIIVHGFGIHPAALVGLHGGALAWIVDAALCGLFGLALGAVIIWTHHSIAAARGHAGA
jgi:uncharacterized protein